MATGDRVVACAANGGGGAERFLVRAELPRRPLGKRLVYNLVEVDGAQQHAMAEQVVLYIVVAEGAELAIGADPRNDHAVVERRIAQRRVAGKQADDCLAAL